MAPLGWAAVPATPTHTRPLALDDLSARSLSTDGSREGDALRAYLVGAANEEVRVGAVLYDRNCAVCHGDTGLGLAEAKLAFPEDHRTCTRCHRPGNATEMSFDEMNLRPNDVFDLGAPPALRGLGALEHFPEPVALWAYTSATMPRYQPGRLAPTEVRAITAFLWEVNGGVTDSASAALAAVAPGPIPPMPAPID